MVLSLVTYFRLLYAITFSKTKFLNFGWPFKSGKGNRKAPIKKTKSLLWPINRRGRLIGVLFTVFY